MPIQLISNELSADVSLNRWDTHAFDMDVWDCLNIELLKEKAQGGRGNVAHALSTGLYIAKVDAGLTGTIDALTRAGFNFRDLSLSPTIDLSTESLVVPDLAVRLAKPDELPVIAEIASDSFKVSRYHAESALPKGMADRRYALWVTNAFKSESQVVYVCEVESQIAAFFIVEPLNGVMYWHLTAIAPKLQGKGLGLRMWASMARLAREQGYAEVRTSISAVNTPVLNLYRKLGASFSNPTIALHRFQGAV